MPGRPAPHQDPHLHLAGAAPGGVAGGQWYQLHRLKVPTGLSKHCYQIKRTKYHLRGGDRCGEVFDALMGPVDEKDVLTVTRLAHEWQVTFARKGPMEVIRECGTITIGGTKFLLRKVVQRSPAGRVRWISPYKLVQVHWLPGYDPV